MIFEIYYRKSAAKELKKLPAVHRPSIIQAIESLRYNPFPDGVKKIPFSISLFSHPSPIFLLLNK